MLVRSIIVLVGLINLAHTPLALAMDELSMSMATNYQQAILEAYDDAIKQWNNDKNKPLIFYIAKNNNSYSWLSLINLAIDNHQLKSHDLMWVIDEYVYAYNLNKEKANNIFNTAIIDQLNSPKRSKYVADLLIILSIQKKQRWLIRSHFNETCNLLTEMIERAYSNAAYLKAFKQIIELIPAELIDRYLSVKRTEGKADKFYNLSGWLMRPVSWAKYNYLERSIYYRDYYMTAAKHIISYRLSEPAILDAEYLDESMINMITLLYKQNDITQEQFNQASTRFKSAKK